MPRLPRCCSWLRLQEGQLLHPDPQGHETKHKRHRFPPSHLLSLRNERGKQMETETPTAIPTVRICQPPLLPIFFANSAVAIFSPFLLGSDKSPSFQYTSYPLQKLFWTSTSTWNRRLCKNSAPQSSSTPATAYLSRHLNHLHCQSILAPVEAAQRAMQLVLTTLSLNHLQHT